MALQLDRRGVAEMSCIAGVGGDVPHLMKTVRSGRPIIALDGCPLVCVKSTLARHGIAADRHYQLQQYGVKKRVHEDFDPVQAALVLETVVEAVQGTHSGGTLVVVRQRPAPLPPRLSEAERAAHAALVAGLGDKAVWNTFRQDRETA